MVAKRIRPPQRIVQGVGEGSDWPVPGPSQDPPPVQLCNIRVLLDEGYVIEDKTVGERVGIERDHHGGQKKTEERDLRVFPRRLPINSSHMEVPLGLSGPASDATGQRPVVAEARVASDSLLHKSSG